MGLFAVCGLSVRAQNSYVPPVVVSSVSPVPVPALEPPLTGSETNLIYPTDLALDACGNIYTLDLGNNFTTGATITEIPVNGGAATVVANLSEYYPGHLGQDPTHKNLIYGRAYGTGGNLVPLVNCVPQPAQAQHTGYGNGALFYYYNPGYLAGDFLGNTYISTQATCCVTGQFYLVQEGSLISGNANNGNILLSNQPAEIESMAVDKNQNIYFISAGVLYELQSYGDGNYATAPVAYGSAYLNPVGVSVDGAGNLYIADEGAATLYEIPNEAVVPGGTALNSADQFIVASGVITAVPVAIDAHGDIYYPGSVYSNAQYSPGAIDKLSLGKANFGTVVLRQTVTRTINVQFNSAFTLGAVRLAPGAFAVEQGVGSNPCAVGSTYRPGENYYSGFCTLAVSFTPTTSGAQTDTLVVQDVQGEAIATAVLKGTGQVAPSPVGTTTTLTINPGSSLVAGEPITLTATVAPDSGSDAATGTVTFADPAGGSVKRQLVYGTATYYGIVPKAGTYSVFAKYNADVGFTGSHSATITSHVTAPPTE